MQEFVHAEVPVFNLLGIDVPNAFEEAVINKVIQVRILLVEFTLVKMCYKIVVNGVVQNVFCLFSASTYVFHSHSQRDQKKKKVVNRITEICFVLIIFKS